MNEREVVGSPKAQGSDEEIAYTFDFTMLGTPTSPVDALYNLTTGADISTTNLSGPVTVSGNTVTTRTVKFLTAGQKYRLNCKVTIGGKVLSAYLILVCDY